MINWKKTIPALNSYHHHRKMWSPRASYHLARYKYGDEWGEKLMSWLWLVENRIPIGRFGYE